METTETPKLVAKNEINNIKLLSWEEIKENFNVKEKDVIKNLSKSNQSNNYWYPYEHKLTEEDVKEIVDIFRVRFCDIVIKSIYNPRFTEFFLNTLEKHQFAYTLIYMFKNRK